jgi:hypothetical protein
LEALDSELMEGSSAALTTGGVERLPKVYPKPKKTAQSSASAKKIPRIVVVPSEISRSCPRESRRSCKSSSFW